MKPFYVTTPIYYVNDNPHIGHAYSTVAADVLARYNKLRGRPGYFLTGLDEHGLKIERAARDNGLQPKAFVDRMAPPFRRAWEVLDCAYDDFIRTTEPRHEERAQRLWQRLEEAGDIYLGEYEDWYCVGCENFYAERDLEEGHLCPTHKRPVEKIKEESYFFRLSKYQDKLLELYESNPHFVQPEGRYNEVKSFVREGLRDLSISRTSFRWGVPVPGNPEHVMYVWLDALTNYISALGGPAPRGEASLFDEFWPPNAEVIHIVGKDILRFHAVYWPAFLMSAGIELPTQIWAHGWLTVDGQKMSKSLGNFLPPEPLCEAFGTDVLRYYFMRDIVFGHDGDFNHRNLLGRYHGELANGLGNLLNRMVASIVKKNLDGVVPQVDLDTLPDQDREIIEIAQRASSTAARHMEAIEPQRALEAIFELASATNRYVDRTAPWQLAKDNQPERLSQVVYTVLESLRWLGVMLWPFMPRKCDEMRRQLGLARLLPTEELDRWPSVWGGMQGGTRTAPGAPLFPRFDDKQQQELLARFGFEQTSTADGGSNAGQGHKDATPTGASEDRMYAKPEDIAKVELRVGRITTAERVPKADKLLRLEVDVGEASPRQILAGIAEHYDPERLPGRTVVVVANLKPRKLKGLESQGMVLAAGDDQGRPSLLSAEGDVSPGSIVK